MRALTIALAALVGAAAAAVQDEGEKAPELTGGVGWINTDKPVTLASLKGKIVLLDFWTYC